MKGYSKDWIDKRLRGIAIRQELTGEWEQRGVQQGKEFAILTNEISKATFGKTVGEYKEFKRINRENLRDHMNDMELIFTMLGEKTTTELTKDRESQGFKECKGSAKEGGEVAGEAREVVEKRLGRTIVSDKKHIPGETKKILK